ncbi:MAG: hypothetical protein KGH67_01800, partial [Candidatus Micrarchaeota archaeon]|nr:hypothetical protein [Candidatus Micrarchaeota archaeon]
RINTTPGGKFAGYNITGAWLQYYTTALNGSISEQVYKSLMAKSLYSTLTKGYESSLYSTNETPVILAANATSNGMTYTALLAKGRGLLVGYTYLIGYKDNEVTSVVVSGNVALASNIVNQSMLASTVGSDMP